MVRKCKHCKKEFPDFYYPEKDLYIEIKGWKRPEFEAKMRDFPHKIKVLLRDGLTEVFDYVTNKYGEEFTDLYEDE